MSAPVPPLASPAERSAHSARASLTRRRARPAEYAWGLIAVGLVTLVCHALDPHFELADLIMIYLLGVVTVSTRFSLYPSIFTAIVSVLVFEFFFVPPRLSFAVLGPTHLVTLTVMLFVAVVTSGLTERARRQADEAHRAQVQAESERLRSLLLSSISHDLKTPLASIIGAASTLLDDETTLDDATRHELTQTVFEESNRLHRQVTNLLHMTRLESGPVEVRREWQPVEEVIGAALTQLESRLRDREVTTHLPATVTSAPFDGVLIEQVLVNLLENALRYTPKTTPIEITVSADDPFVTIAVADRGRGIAAGEEERIFEKFYRSERGLADGGIGLGLAICRGIVQAHGGRIWAESRAGGGSVFRFTLPRSGDGRLAEGPALPEVDAVPEQARPTEPLEGKP